MCQSIIDCEEEVGHEDTGRVMTPAGDQHAVVTLGEGGRRREEGEGGGGGRNGIERDRTSVSIRAHPPSPPCLTRRKTGSLLSRVPLASRMDGGPVPSLEYSHNLNHTLFISVTAGPMWGGTQLLILCTS